MSAMTPSQIGARAEAAVASALTRSGRAVFLPAFGLDSRTDLVHEGDTGLVRVQCKTARLNGQVLIFRTCSNTNNRPRSYVDEVDEFGVYTPDLNVVYLVPADGLPSRLCSLRLSPARNGQTRGVWWADDYVLGPP